jgi:hypothetical protein
MFEDAVQTFSSAFPVIKGRLARAWSLEPYWKLVDNSTVDSVRVNVVSLDYADVNSVLEQCVNSPFRHSLEYLVFHVLVCSGGEYYLAMQFDHRLFDARGAEMFLDLFVKFCRKDISLDDLSSSCYAQRPTLLNKWRERFSSGKALIRHMREMSNCNIIAPAQRVRQEGESSFINILLNESESKSFMARANSEAGFLMFMPYAMAVSVQVFAKIFNSESGNYIIPCTTDLRNVTAECSEMFFNYCSLLFFNVDHAETTNRLELISAIKNQFYNHSKYNFARDFEAATALMRILPLKMFTKIMTSRFMRSCLGSFAFSLTGSNIIGEQSFHGVSIRNIFHMPHVPPQVGMGFFFSRYRNRMNICVSYRRPLIDVDERRMIVDELMRACGTD